MNTLKRFWQKITGKAKPINQNPDQIESKQLKAGAISFKMKRANDLYIAGGVILMIILGILFLSRKTTTEEKHEDKEHVLSVEVAANALDIEKMWRGHFEDKIQESKVAVDNKIQLIENSINEQSTSYREQVKADNDKLRAQLEYIIEEQIALKEEIQHAKNRDHRQEEDSRYPMPAVEERITVNNMQRGELFDRPKSARTFIPETAHVQGVLLGGIAVSTAIGSSAEPVPVIIRVTDRGSLPSNFKIEPTYCKIMGSAYGDLSSERAVVRAEVLSCKDPASETIYTTKVVGLIYGDDGMNGIKGKVVQTSSKHLKNALVGSVISGFASSAKGQEQIVLGNASSTYSKKKDAGTMLKEGAFAGASNAGEKIADYYIKQAEAMSPVLLVTGGTKVDIVFTKGVYFGALDVHDRLEQARGEKVK